jgi:BASS family bile acid:Na+ symporter
MVGFAVAIMEGVTDTAMVDPQRVALWTLAGLAANPLLQVLGYAGTRFLGRNRGLTVGLMMGNRNMGLLLAALPAGADPGVALFFAVAQIPMYTLPALQKRLYQRIART